jgi:hypothetical protein
MRAKGACLAPAMRMLLGFDFIRAILLFTLATQAPARNDEEQQKLLDASARTAWNYVKRTTSPTTGLARALDSWEYITTWDIGSNLAAIHSARALQIIDASEYRSRMDKVLATLERMPLYQETAFNRQYSSRSGKMVDRNQKVSETGFGWSAIDMGRFLIALKIIEQNDPTAAPVVQRIIARLKLPSLAQSGYLNGANRDVKFNNHFEYQEGRIGYEQYGAEGLALWGVRADSALSFQTNGRAVTVMGQSLLADARRDDMLTSEPFIMTGLELGWTNPTWEEQSRNMLAAQQERHRKTGRITMASEDAIPVAPMHFYYYLVHRNGQDFIITGPGGETGKSYPRWISVKAAYAWHALFPSDYTWSAVTAVKRAGSTGRGWNAGVYEYSKRPTPMFNLNTAAVVLESVLYAKRGCPLVKPTC